MYRVGDIVRLPGLDELDNPVREVLGIDSDGALVIRYPEGVGNGTRTHRWNPNVGVAPTVVVPKLEVGDYVVERSRPNGRPMRVTMAPHDSHVRADRRWWSRGTLTRVGDGAAARKLLDDGADPVTAGIEETYDESTLEKVHEILAKRWGSRPATDVISELQNAGILFRERPRPPLPTEIGAVISDVVTRSGRRFIRAMRGKRCWFVLGLDGTWSSFPPEDIASWESNS